MKVRNAFLTLLTAGVLGSGAASASTINLTTYSTAYQGYSFFGFAYDPATQQYYSHEGVGYPASQPVDSYSSAAAFQAGLATGSTAIPNANDPTLGTVSPPTGTYLVVNNGMLYGRTDASSNKIGEWNAATGALVATAAIPGVAGANFTDTFNWGGFSALNMFNDNGQLYMLAMDTAGTNWEIIQLSPNLTVENTIVTSLPVSIGYAFAINGELFVGDSFDSNQISQEVNLSTGAVSAVNYTFSGDPANPYLSDMFYDQGNDTLYMYDTASNSKALYDATDASALFDAPAPTATPEPGSFALLFSGMLSVGLLTWAKRSRGLLPAD